MPEGACTKVVDFEQFFGKSRETQGKTLTFYFTKSDLATFQKLQRWLHYPDQKTRALRAILKLAFLVVSKVYEGYEIRIEKPGVETLSLQLFGAE